MRELENRRVRMRFDDGHEVVATLLSATQDMDGSLHLIYDRVESATEPNAYFSEKASSSAFYSEGEALIEIEPVDSVDA